MASQRETLAVEPPTASLLSESPEATRAFAAAMARVARAGDVVALYGALGAGKTEFVKGFAGGLGVPGVIDSPSFVLMAEYLGRLPMYHLDLYRLAGPLDALDSGLLDERRSAGVTLVEWAERLGSLLPAEHLAVHIEGSGEEPRRIGLVVTGRGPQRYLDALQRETR